MTQHNPPTDAELLLNDFKRWADEAAEEGRSVSHLHVDNLRRAIAVLDQRAAPLGYDAALRVAEAVRDEALTEVTHGEDCPARRGHECSAYQCERAGVAEMDLPAIVRATLGDDAVARAETERER